MATAACYWPGGLLVLQPGECGNTRRWDGVWGLGLCLCVGAVPRCGAALRVSDAGPWSLHRLSTLHTLACLAAIDSVSDVLLQDKEVLLWGIIPISQTAMLRFNPEKRIEPRACIVNT